MAKRLKEPSSKAHFVEWAKYNIQMAKGDFAERDYGGAGVYLAMAVADMSYHLDWLADSALTSKADVAWLAKDVKEAADAIHALGIAINMVRAAETIGRQHVKTARAAVNESLKFVNVIISDIE